MFPQQSRWCLQKVLSALLLFAPSFFVGASCPSPKPFYCSLCPPPPPPSFMGSCGVFSEESSLRDKAQIPPVYAAPSSRLNPSFSFFSKLRAFPFFTPLLVVEGNWPRIRWIDSASLPFSQSALGIFRPMQNCSAFRGFSSCVRVFPCPPSFIYRFSVTSLH